MKSRRFVIYFFVTGVFFKTLSVVLWRLYQPYIIAKLFFDYDPVGISTAFMAKYIFVDWWRLISVPNEAIFFDVILVITFGIALWRCFRYST